MRYALIRAENASFPSIAWMCRRLGVSTSGYYAWCDREPSTRTKKDEQRKVLVAASFDESRKTYGSPRVVEDLRAVGEHVGRNRVIRLMQAQGLRARVRKRFKCTTNSEHDQPIAPNVLERKFDADAPNQRWVGDTTEMLTTSGGKFYLAAIIDLYSRFCVGWAVSAVNDRHLTMRALEAAIRRRCPSAGLLHHSDQGSTGEFNRSSQHLNKEELQWAHRNGDARLSQGVPRYVRQGDRPQGAESIEQPSGRRSRVDCPAKRRR